jgi:hypothetical protein
MSIQDLIRDCVDGGELVRLSPRLSSHPVMRDIFVNHRILQFLQQRAPGVPTNLLKRATDTRLVLDRFSAGARIAVRMDPDADAPSAELARNKETTAGIWEFRVRDPKPHVRVFGGFALRDVFVALDYRAKPLDYDAAVEKTLDLWRDLFNDCGPVTGDDINGYLSDRYHLV